MQPCRSMPAGTLAGVPVFPIIMFFPSSVQGAPFVRSALCAGVAAAFTLVTSAAQASEAVESLETIVVTATRDARPLSQSLASVSVLTREDIEQRPATTVVDLLKYLPGVQIARNGSAVSTSSLFLRGADTRHTLVLIDGVPVDSQSTGGAPFEALLVSDIERIEVVRGGASAVYGGTPIAGVVQIFTRTRETDKARVELGLGAGNLGTVKANAKVSGQHDRVNYNVSVQQQRSSGFDSSSNSLPNTAKADRDGYRAKGVNASIGWQVLPGQRIEASTRSQFTQGGYDAFSATLDDKSTNEVNSTGVTWSSVWADIWKSQIRLGQTDARYSTQPSPYSTHTTLRVASLENSLSFGPQQVRITIDGQEDKLVNSSLSQTPTPGEGVRRNGALGLGYDGKADQWLWSASAREDHDSEFGVNVTGSASLGYQIMKGLTVRGGWANAFRAPTLYQRFSIYGNANLLAETSQTRELGIRWNQLPMTVELTAFDSDVKNLIGFRSSRYENTSRAELKGVELTASRAFGDSRMEVNMNWDSPKNADTGLVLNRRARQHGSLRVETEFSGWSVGGAALFSAYRMDGSSSKVRLGGYTTLALDAQKTIAPGVTLLIQSENLTNKKYETAAGYNSAPRTVFVALKWVPSL